MRTLTYAALAAVITASAIAQDLDDRYNAIGTFEGTVGGEAVSFTSVFDTEADRYPSGIQLRDRTGFTTIDIRATAITEDGAPDKGSVSFFVGPIGTGMPGDKIEVTATRDGVFYVASVDFKNRIPVTDFELTKEKVTFSVEGDLQAAKTVAGEFVVDPSLPSIKITGTFSGAPTDVD